MFRCAASWVTLSAFPPAEFAQTELLQTTFRTLVSNNQHAVLRASKTKPHTAISRKVVVKVYATILKGIVDGFEFSVLQRNLKEWHERPWTYVCECERKATKVGSTAIVSGTVC